MPHDPKALTAALDYLATGFSLLPIRADGSKRPRLSQWKPLQTAPPTVAQVRAWFGADTPCGIGLIHGAVSGHSEVLDFDEKGLYSQFADLCTTQGLADLLDRIPLIETPSGGHHLLYRCTQPVGGNTKLAETVKRKTLIETRGEGGYSLAPGSPPACHPDGKPYCFERGTPQTVPTLTAAERDALHTTARLFDACLEPSARVEEPTPRPENGAGLRPGDEYNSRGNYAALLERHGWRCLRHVGSKTLWHRPGKSGPGLSATGNYADSGLFFVFSSNASPFEPNRAYSPFAVFAYLEYGGDFHTAAQELLKMGYGEPQKHSTATFAALRVYNRDEAWEPLLPFSTHQLPPFPTESLPPILRAYVCEIAASSQVPVDMGAMLALAVVAVAGARRCDLQIGRTHREPLNLFCTVIMEPGSRKSALMDMTAPLRDHEARLCLQQAPLIAAAKEARAVEEKRVGFLRDQAAKEKDSLKRGEILGNLQELAASLSEVPTAPRLLADDITPEKLAGIMAENAGAMALLSAEGGIFGILAGRYTSKQDANFDVFLRGHSGDEIRVDRQSRPPDFIRRPALTVGLLVQPDVITSLADNPSFRGRGLLGRFLYSQPESLAGTRMYQDRPVDPLIKARYDAAIRRVLELPSAGTDEDPSARHSLSLTGDALALWAEYANEVEARQAEGRDLAGVRDWASKLAGQVARIAAGFHLVERAGGDWRSPISREAVAAAWAIGHYLIPHALTAFGQMGADPRLALARRIVRWMERSLTPGEIKPGDTGEGKLSEAQFTLRECQRSHTGGGQTLTADDVHAALLILVEREYIRPAQARQETGGRPGSAPYVVNPAVFAPKEPGQ